MDQLTAHAKAQAVFAAVLANVRPDQHGAATPCSEWTVRDVVEHVVGGNDRTAGRSAPASTEPATTGGEGTDLELRVSASAERAQAAFATPDGMTRTFDLPIGPVPGSVLVGMRTTDVLVHAWDLAVATGQSTDLDPELSRQCLEAARARVQESFRGPGRPFGTEQECPPDRPPADQLAAFLGRVVV